MLNLLQGRLVCGFAGFILLVFLQCGSTLIGGVHSEGQRFAHGVLTHNFVVTKRKAREVAATEMDDPQSALTESVEVEQGRENGQVETGAVDDDAPQDADETGDSVAVQERSGGTSLNDSVSSHVSEDLGKR